jgi:hypothetical protein
MKTLIGCFFALGFASIAFAGCTGDDAVPLKPIVPVDSGIPDTSTPDTGVVVDSGTDSGTPTPPPPALGVQIDRFGRPAVNTALNATFLTPGPAAIIAKDDYNADKNAAGWSAKYKAEVATNLGILDSLNKVCGDQLLAGGAATPPVAGRYGGLAAILADDRMWVNTASATCAQYLAVEANVAGIANTDCGGRTLKYDVIDTTYSVLAAGALSGVDDGVAADPAKTGGTAFPYLAAPLP